MPLSNNNGRAFEYLICNQLKKSLSNIVFTERVNDEQLRDSYKIHNLSDSDLKLYSLSADQICNWLIEKYQLNISPKIILDRLPDKYGVLGDVTDVKLTNGKDIINISLKHNHSALKHPRLTRVPNWIGITDKKIVNSYKNQYNLLWSNIIHDAENKITDIQYFRELNELSPEYINNNIYEPFCSLVKDFLNLNINNSSHVSQLFKFMVGNQNFIKIIDYPNYISVQNFYNIPTPTIVDITHPKVNYLKMDFSNNWVIDLRLHTASSRLHTKSIKFDVQPNAIPVEEIILNK